MCSPFAVAKVSSASNVRRVYLLAVCWYDGDSSDLSAARLGGAVNKWPT